MGGISIWQLLIIAAIVVLLFGTKKLRGMGGDLGAAVKGFKDSVKDGDAKTEQEQAEPEKLTQKSEQVDADFNSAEKTEQEKK